MAELASWDEVFDAVEKSKSVKQSSNPTPKAKAEPESWDDVDAAIKEVESGFSQEYLKELKAAEAVAQIGIESAPLGVQEWGAAAALPPEYRRAALERSAELFKERGPMKGAGNIKRTAVAIAQGGVDWGMPAASFFAPKELQLDGDQEAFRQALISVREGSDPSLSEGSIASTIQQAARMAVPMVGMGVAGRASGTLASSAGLGAVGTRIAQGVGVTAAAYPMAADQSYRTMIAEGLDPEIAAPISRISGLFEGAIESVIPDPFKVQSGVLRGSIRRIVAEGVRRAGVQAGRIGIEASEEGAQAFTREAMYEVARAIDEDIPNQGLGQAFVAAAEEGLQSIGPLTVVMGPSITLGALGTARNTASRPEQYRQAIERRDFERFRRELTNAPDAPSQVPTDTESAERLSQLQEIRSKGFVSEEDAKQAGIEGKSRKERLANADKEIEELQKPSPSPWNDKFLAEEDARIQQQQGQQSRPWWDFGSGEPQGEIPAPPGLALFDRLTGRSAQTEQGAVNPPLPAEAETPTVPTWKEMESTAIELLTNQAKAEQWSEEGLKARTDHVAILTKQAMSGNKEAQAALAEYARPKAAPSQPIQEPTAPQEQAGSAVTTTTPNPEQPVTAPVPQQPKGSDPNTEAGQVPPSTTTPQGKEPWELTRSEHVAERERRIAEFRRLSDENGGGPEAMRVPEVAEAFRAQEEWSDLDIGHKPSVQKAVKEGKPVPASVLAEYPNINAATPSATEQPTVRQGKVGDMLASGEVVTTSSGRQTTPFPSVDTSSDRKAQNTIKRADKWLHENAVEEARSRGDDFNLTSFSAEDPAKLPPASKDAMEEYLFGKQPDVVPQITKPLVPPKSESKWQAETRAKLDAVPALKGSKFDMDEKVGRVDVTRPDGLKATIHFNADEELAKAAVAKGRNPNSIHGRAVRRSETEFDIYVRSDANHTNILNHEVMHWLEFNGVVTKEEVEKYGGREAIAEKYGKWAEVKLRKKDSVFQRIYDALEAVFSSQRKFFEEVGERKANKPQENLSKDKKSSDSTDEQVGSKSEPSADQAKPEPESPAPESGSLSVDEFADVFKSYAQPAASEPSSESSPKKPRSIRKDTPRKPKATGEKKTPSEGVQEGLDEAKAGADLIRKGLKDLGSSFFSGPPINRDIAVGMGMMANGLIKAGKYKFIEFIDQAVEMLGAPAVRYLGPYLEAGWNKIAEADSRLDKATSVSDYLVEPDAVEGSDYGTLEAPNRVELGKHFQQQLESGKDYKSIVEARKEAATLIAGEDANIEPGTPAAKAIDEAVEQGVVRAARSIAESSSDPLKVYDNLLDLYERQPRLAVRTGTSMRQQAYSTPAPAAWIATILSDTKRDNTAYDSSAGNGMLLLGVEPENAMANELNPDRADALRALGYDVHEGDATEYTPDTPPERIIINPPFGEDVEGKTWNIGGTTTDKIDHAIVLKTLESLPEDGKAVLIIGSKGFEQRQPKDELRRGEAYKNDKNFYNALYDGYNVTDHFTLHGDLYAKQGAAFPIDVIVIDGRGQSALPKPYQIDRQNAIPRVINSWKELRDVGERYLDTGTGRPSDLSTEPVADDMAGLSSLLEGQGEGDGGKGGKSKGSPGGRSSISSRGGSKTEQPRGDSGQPDISGSPEKQGSDKSKRLPDNDKSSSTARSDRGDDSKDLDRVGDVEDQETGFQTAYKQRSNSRNVGTLVPTTHVKAVQDALDKAEDRYGNLDEFVASELGYDVEELQGYFSAEQVDALALTIARHKEGKAFVLGDQTGVGKGRVAAATMVYAKRQGLVPVFVTQSSDLYADMYRDLQDIGQHTEDEPFYALATNTLMGKDRIQLPDGTIMQQSADFSKDTFNDVAASVVMGDGPVAMIVVEKTTGADGKPLGLTPAGKQRVRKVKEQREYDAVFTAYSQMSTVAGETKDRHAAMSSIAPNAFFVLDESHNAGGVNDGGGAHGDANEGPVGRAARLRSLVSEAQGVLFLSATFAKNPGVMDLYAKTGMGDAIKGSDEDLIETIIKGGIPLQQVLSEMLVESGTYMRREKSFQGIEFSAKVEDTGLAEADEVAGIFNSINELDRIKNEIIKSKSFKRWLIAQGMGLGKDSATGKRGLDSSQFSSIVHNLVDQMLLSIKADAVADEAIATLKRGESPIIALSNTAGAALTNYLENFPAEVGEEINFSFNTTARRYLERSREIMLTDVDATGKKTSRSVRLPDEVLGEDGIAAYRAAEQLIEGFAADIPASPIDHIRNRLEEAGYKVAEITGRSTMVDYSGGKMRLARRPASEQGKAGKLASVKGYNSGEIDALILNQSGSTGLSAHASKNFINQKRRHMIVAQADRNIDTFMQMLGRINRTGQVEQHEGQAKGSNLPYYTLLMTNVPAEIRPASVLMKKLASLNANVTADAKGSVAFDAPDILNKVGDRVVAEYIANNPALNHALGDANDIVEVNPEGSPKVMPDIARKVSGRMAMRPIPEQKAFWDSVTETYAEEIEQLNKLGKNPLAATKLDLGAKTLERVEIFAGDITADSPFLQPAYADRALVKKQGEPMTPDEIKKSINQFYGLRPKRKRGTDPFGDMAAEMHREAITGEDAPQNVTVTEPNLRQAIAAWTAEQAEVASEAINSKAEQQIARLVNQEAIDRVRARASTIETSIRRRLNSIAPGMAVAVSEMQEGGTYSGSITGIVIDVKAKKGSEHLPSGWVATIAISSPDRVVRVPFSRIETAGQAGDMYVAPMFEIAGELTYAEWEEIGDVYEERIIGTGNVLAAFDQLVSEGDRGNIVFFTNEEGISQRGVLMPRSFNLDRWAEKRPVTFATAQQVIEFISIDPEHQASDPNFAIQITMDGTTMNVRSPRSRQRSGKYTTNQELIAASGTDFVSVGQILQMKVKGRKQQLAVIEAIQKIGPLIASNFKEDARAIAGTITPQSKNPTRQTRTSGSRVPDEAPGIAAADIQKTVEEMFGVAVRQGGFSQRAEGIYKWLTRSSKSPPSPEIIRTKEDQYASLATLAHEVAHHIDETAKVVNNMPNPVKQEVRTLDYEPQKARTFEGWAEFFRRYVTEPPIDVNGNMMPNTFIDAPQTTEWFEKTFLPTHPKLAGSIEQFRKYAQQWANQSVFARVGTMITDRKPHDLRFAERWKQKGKRWLNRLKSNFIDKFHTLKWIQDEAKSLGYRGIGIYDLTMAYFMSASSHATIAFEEGVRTLTEGKPIGNTKLWELSRHLENDGEYDEAVRYALARHTLFMDQTKPGYNTGVDVEDAQALVDEFKALGKADRFENFSKELAQFNDDLIMMLVDAGALSKEDAKKILDYYRDSNGVPHYFPLHRVMDLDKSDFAGTGAGFVNLGTPVRGRSRSGSGRQIIDPIDATITRTIKFYGRAIQARQAHALARTLDPLLGGVGGMGGLMDRIPAKRIVHQGTIEEILNTLVDSGTIEADQARAMRIAARILDPANGMASDRDLDWFANKHQIIDWQNNWADMEFAAETEPDALSVISLWRPDYTPNAAKRTVMIYDQAGNKLMYELDDDLYQTATGMQEVQFNVFMNLLRETQKYFKSGAVALSTGFGTANFIRDYGEFQGKANYVKGLRTITKPWQMLGRYIAAKVQQSLAGKYVGKKLGIAQKPANALIRLHEELGGKIYSVIGSEASSRTVYRRKKLGKSTMSKLGLSVMRPVETAEGVLQFLQDIIAISDAPPRLADAEAALAEHGFVASGDKWLDTRTGNIVDHLPESARIAAAVAIAEATINFKRVGAAGAYVEAFLPFFNATVQATYRQYQQVKNLKNLGQDTPEGERAKRLLVYLAALASHAVLYWLWRHDDDDYRNQDGWLRDGYWTWGANGKTYVRIPKPRDFAIVSNVVENMLDGASHEDARKTSSVIMRDIGGRIPTGGGLTRGAVETYIANYDYFRGRELENESMKDIPKQYRTSSYTSRMSDYLGKHLGKVLNTSPIQFQHLLNSASGGMYGRLTDAYDAAQDGRIGPEHYPFIRGVMLDRLQTRPVSEFYEKKQELDGIAATKQIERDMLVKQIEELKADQPTSLKQIAGLEKQLAAKESESPEVADKLAHFGWISEVMTALRQGEAKIGKKRTFENEKYITGLARAALGYEEQESNPNPLTSKDLPQDIRETIDEYRQLAVAGAAERLSPRSVFKSDEAYEKQKSQIERAEAKFRSINMTFDEAKQSLKEYWKKTYGKLPDPSKYRKLESLFSKAND